MADYCKALGSEPLLVKATTHYEGTKSWALSNVNSSGSDIPFFSCQPVSCPSERRKRERVRQTHSDSISRTMSGTKRKASGEQGLPIAKRISLSFIQRSDIDDIKDLIAAIRTRKGKRISFSICLLTLTKLDSLKRKAKRIFLSWRLGRMERTQERNATRAYRPSRRESSLYPR